MQNGMTSRYEQVLVLIVTLIYFREDYIERHISDLKKTLRDMISKDCKYRGRAP
jgi:hypothetical protein